MDVRCVQSGGRQRSSAAGRAWLLAALLLPSAWGQGPWINEVLPLDGNILADEDDDFPGWIELSNPGPQPADLQDWGLSDDLTRPFKWVFPVVRLAPGESLVVFTSGKNRRLLTTPETAGFSAAAPVTPDSVAGLVLWLDAADSNSFQLVDGQVAEWRDKSGYIRREPEPEPLTPDRAPGLCLWLDAADGNTLEVIEGRVAAWRDKSGQGHHAVQDEPTRRPVVAGDSASGLTALSFDGRDDYLAFPRLENVVGLAWVGREAAEASDRFRVVLGDTAATDFHRGYEKAIYLGGMGLHELFSQARTWLNGNPVEPTTTPLPASAVMVMTTTLLSHPLALIGSDRLIADHFWQGDIREVLLFDQRLSDAERLGIEAYLRRKWRTHEWPAAIAYHPRQPVRERRPARVWDPITGQGVVRFDGEHDVLVFPRQERIRTVLWVARENLNGNKTACPLLGDATFNDFERAASGALYSALYASSAIWSGTVRINGQPVNPVAAYLPPSWVAATTVAAADCNAGVLAGDTRAAGRFWRGDVGELLLYDRPLSAADCASLEAYLARKWRLPARALHANFSLATGGGNLLLTKPDGAVADQIVLPTLRKDVSLGRAPGGTDANVYFLTPTPGAPNSAATYHGVAPDPSPQPRGGLFTPSVVVAVATNASSGSIYYTTDGSEPLEPLAQPVDVVWFDDALPEPTYVAASEGDRWSWTNEGPPFSGYQAFRSDVVPGFHYHVFAGASLELPVRAGDRLLAYVYLDPASPPREVMLMWYDGSHEHRAYWGENLVEIGADLPPSRVRVGNLPAPGQWSRLEVPAEAVNLAGRRVNGVAFVLFDGRAAFDFVGRSTTRPGTALPYTGPLTLTTNTVLRFRAFAPGAVPSQTVTASYLVNWASTIAIVSLATQPENLFSSDRGLLAKGTNASPGLPYLGANFWKDWERPVHVEFFEPDGRLGFSQEAGVQVSGNWSRSAPQKSLELHARKKYGDTKFRHQVFPEGPLREFDTLLLRNSGNDWLATMFRDAFQQSLLAGWELDRQAYRPAHVFLNGQYWGILNLREKIDPDYLAAYHAVSPDNVDMIANERYAIDGDNLDYEALIAFVKTHELSRATNYDRVAAWVDLESFLDFQVAEVFCDNRDWPGNNTFCWRQRTPPTRWRWIVRDLDAGFTLFPPGSSRNTLRTATGADPYGSDSARSVLLLRLLLGNAEFRQRYINRFADCLNTTFQSQAVLGRIDEFAARLEPEIQRHIDRWGRVQAFGWASFTNLAAWQNNVEGLRIFARERPAYVREHVSDYFGLEGTARMTVAALGGGGAIRVSQITLNETQLPWTGIYFRGVPVTVTALPRETHRFVGWQGRAETNATLEVDLAGDLALTAVFAPQWGYQDPSWRPKPFDLWGRAYSLASFSAATPAGVYPPNMLFLQSSVRDPGLEVETDSEWQLPYNLSSKSRVRALGDLGFSFLNTSEPQAEPGAGFLGAAVLSLRTLSVQHVRVTWTGGTVNPNSRGYAIRLQYRVGSQGSFQDVPDAAGKPVEYVRSEVIGDLQVLGPVELPAAADNQPLVQLRWKYYALPGSASGARAELRVDDIFVTGQSLGPLLGGINALGQGVLRAQFLGVPARAVTVESSQDLKEWLPWRAREFDADGWFMLEEPALGGGAARFFRLRVP